MRWRRLRRDRRDDGGWVVRIPRRWHRSNWSGGLSATRHLIDLGHRRIATITGPPHALSSRARLDGYRAALDTAGIRVPGPVPVPHHTGPGPRVA